MNATRDNYTEVRKLTENYVRGKLTDYLLARVNPIQVNSEGFDHGVDIGVSILETKWPQIGMYLGGDFVKAVCNNDLMEAVGRADEVNRQLLHFHCQLLYNFTPTDLNE